MLIDKADTRFSHLGLGVLSIPIVRPRFLYRDRPSVPALISEDTKRSCEDEKYFMDPAGKGNTGAGMACGTIGSVVCCIVVVVIRSSLSYNF